VKTLRNAISGSGPAAVALLVAGILVVGGCTGGPAFEDLYARATRAARDCNFDDAVSLTDRCLDQRTDDVKALILRGYCRYRLLTPEQMHNAYSNSTVLRDVQKAAELAPQDFMAQYFYGWMLFEAGNYGGALKPLERAYELKDQCREREDALLAMLSMCCVNQGLARGRTYLQGLRRFSGFERSALVYNALGVLSARQQDCQGALGYFMEALRRDPKHAVVLTNLAVLYDERLQSPDEAVTYYRRAIAARQAMHDTTRVKEITERLKQLAAARRRPASGRR
jgi:tetratricopeptide (TPR) repeat protein